MRFDLKSWKWQANVSCVYPQARLKNEDLAIIWLSESRCRYVCLFGEVTGKLHQISSIPHSVPVKPGAPCLSCEIPRISKDTLLMILNEQGSHVHNEQPFALDFLGAGAINKTVQLHRRCDVDLKQDQATLTLTLHTPHFTRHNSHSTLHPSHFTLHI